MSLRNEYNEDFDGSSPSPRRSDRQGFTSEELKLRLYQTVKKKGIYDSLKSQLRRKLVFELNPSIEEIKTKAGETSLKRTSKSNLALNTINCLIIDHLRNNEFDYTLSVFMPECGININEVYSLEDILHILKISPQSKIYEKLENSTVKSKGLLWYLVNYLCQHYVTNDAGVQTEFDGMHSITSNLDDKLKRLDKHYDELNETLSSRLSFEEKLIGYQKQLEEKSKQELAEKMNEFKENELAKLRIEERERQRREFATYRQELEAQLGKRTEALSAREATSEALLKERREREERELFQQRQKLLEEMKQLREKESDFKRSILSQTKLGESDTAKIERIENELKRREERVRQSEVDIDTRLKDEREKIKIDLERTYSQRELILETTETKLKQEASQLSIERSRLETLKHEYQAQLLRLSELDLELQKCRGECACLKQENALLKETVQKTLDYDFIKQENRDLRQKLDISKEIIGEKQLTARGISGGRLSERKRSVTFEQEGGGLNSQRRHILPLNLAEENDEKTEAGIDPALTYQEEGERILDEAVERAQVSRRLEEQNMVNGELRDLYEMQLYEQRKLTDTINDVKRQVEFLYYGVTTEDDMIKSAMKPTMLIDDKGLSDCGNFLSQAKDRLKFLETENERIENSFRDYQHKIKSKYYPINDDEDKEMRIVVEKKSAFKPEDVEAFLESTLKATAKAKQMREELEQEAQRHAPQEQATDQLYQKVANLRVVDEMIKSVPLIQPRDDESTSEKHLDSNAKFKGVNFDELNINTNRSVDAKISKSKSKSSRNDSDSSSIQSSPTFKRFEAKKAPSLKESDDETETKSESTTKPATNIKSYLSMVDSGNVKPDTNNRSEREEVKSTTKRIQIEYSDSSSSSESVFEKPTNKPSSKAQSPVKKSNNNEEDDDDFDW